ncbi:MAG: DUF5928 domain-containing protein, partial [Rhodobacteraceae bacterium]|nr:DUF5928 domain-containing protein [Paracoccaceae bacterium]
KKWHVAKRLLESIHAQTGVPSIAYLFNEESTPLPDLGGIQATLGKRTRHRRALMRMLFDYYDTDRLVICLDPSALDLLFDFFGDRSRTRLLEVQCRFSDEYLVGHATRIGLAGSQTPQETLERILPTIRQDMVLESDRIRDANFENHVRMREGDSLEEHVATLMGFLSIDRETAETLAKTQHLFAD